VYGIVYTGIPLNLARGQRSAVSFPIRVWGGASTDRSPNQNQIWSTLALKYDICWQQFDFYSPENEQTKFSAALKTLKPWGPGPWLIWPMRLCDPG